MKTPTHMVIGYCLSQLLPGDDKEKTLWVIAGAALPDLPLIIIAVACWFLAKWCPEYFSFISLVDGFYFKNQTFIALHHLLHAPLSIAALALCWKCANCHPRGLWFLAGAASHSLVDLFTHAQDGILLFWPLNWNYRFNAGVNQWDIDGAGLVLAVLECASLFAFIALKTWSTYKPYRQFFAY